MMKKLLIFFPLLITGCSVYESEFTCGAGTGMPCTSLYKVDRAVSRGEIDFELEEDPLSIKSQKSSAVEDPIKYELIWVAPRMDSNGNMHGEKYLQVRQ